MSAEPFDVSPVIARLKAGVASLKRVSGAADYATIKALRDFTTPDAFVLLAREKPIPRAGGGHQAATVNFGVVLAVRNYREQRGVQSDNELRTVLGQIRGVLMGWIPDVPGGRACQLVQGAVLDYDASTLIWSDVYQTQHFLQP